LNLTEDQVSFTFLDLALNEHIIFQIFQTEYLVNTSVRLCVHIPVIESDDVINCHFRYYSTLTICMENSISMKFVLSSVDDTSSRMFLLKSSWQAGVSNNFIVYSNN